MQSEEGDRFDHLKKALKIAEGFGESSPRLFETLVRLAEYCSDMDEDQEGCSVDSYVKRALRIRTKVQPADLKLADVLMDLGYVSYNAEDSRAAFQQVREIRERILGEEHPDTARAYAAIAFVEADKQGRAVMDHALGLGAKYYPRSADFADLIVDSAQLYERHDSPGQAEQEYRRAVALREQIWGPRDERFLKSLTSVANSTRWGKNAPLAEELFRRVLDVRKTKPGIRSEEYYSAATLLAQFLSSKKRNDEAEAVYLEALATRERMGKMDLAMARTLAAIADCRMALGKYLPAAEAAERSVSLAGSSNGDERVLHFRMKGLLARAYLQGHDSIRSEKAFLDLSQEGTAQSRFYLIDAADDLSKIYEQRGDLPASAAKLESSLAAMEVDNPKNPQIPPKMIQLGQLYQRMGRLDDANRMTYGALGRVMTQQTDLNPQQQRSLWIGIGVVLMLPIVALAACLVAYYFLARRVDRKLSPLFQPPPPLPSPIPEWALEYPPPLPGAPEAGQPPPPLPPRLPQPLPAYRVSLTAEGEALFSIRVINMLFSICTLGVYHFWGKAKVRRYVCGEAEFKGDRFAFHGTGRELLLGWLRALPALAFIFLFPYVLPLVWESRWSPVIAQLASLGAVGILWPVAVVGAHRYRLNRMSWRAIRFSYRGSTLRYLLTSLIGFLLTILTLGVYWPFLQVRLRRLLYDETYFGDRAFKFNGRGSDLVFPWIFAMPLMFLTFGLAWAWWSAFRERYYWAHTTLAGTRFRCNVSGGELLALWLGNLAIVVLTIGLGSSWAMIRTLRFWTDRVEIVGEPEIATIRQDAQAVSAIGEGFADFLGFDFGI